MSFPIPLLRAILRISNQFLTNGYCKFGNKPSVAYWEYDLTDHLTTLEPNTYELRSRFWVDHPLVDGGDLDGDGEIDLYRPEDLGWDTTNFITILSE